MFFINIEKDNSFSITQEGMIQIKDEGIILEKTNLDFENQAVFNPTCIEVDGITHMFYRAVRHGSFSTIGYCQILDNKVIYRLPYPVLKPEYEYESYGIEDPRIVCLDGMYYLFYTVYDGKNAVVAYATSNKIPEFKKQGIISPQISYAYAENLFKNSKLEEQYHLFAETYQKWSGKDVLLWEKDACIFPRKFNNKFALMHRVLPGIQIAYFDNFSDLSTEYWEYYLKNLHSHIVLDRKFWFESRNIGGGCPPLETKDGWLLIYHGVENAISPDDNGNGNHKKIRIYNHRAYHACAALLDKNDPQKVIGRLEEPLFSPALSWEKQGDVPDVVFPTGAIIKNDRLFIYYGAADTVIAAKSLNIHELLDVLKNKKDETKIVTRTREL